MIALPGPRLRHCFKVLPVMVAMAAGFVPGEAEGGERNVGTADKGWYTQEGFHDPDTQNYIVGRDGFPVSSATTFRNFFVFDLPATTEPVLLAELELFQPSTGYVSFDSSETLEIYDVTTPIATLTAGGEHETGIWTDLGSGTIYGNKVVASTDVNKYITVPLGGAIFGKIATGGKIALGGALTSLSGAESSTEELFSASNGTAVVLRVISAGLPSLINKPVDQVGSTTATFHADVIPYGSPTTVTFYANGEKVGSVSAGGGIEKVSVELKATGLNPDTYYAGEAVAKNGYGDVDGLREDFETGPATAPKPDGSISKSASSGFVGANVFNTTAVKQTASLEIKRGGNKMFYAKVQNVASASGGIRVKGAAGTKAFEVTYLDAKGKDITKQVVAGNYTTASLSYGDTAAVRMKVKPVKTAKAGAKATFKMTFQAVNDPTMKDVVAAAVTAK